MRSYALKSCSLKILALNGCELDNAQVTLLVEALKESTTLTEVHLIGCSVTAEDQQALHEARMTKPTPCQIFLSDSVRLGENASASTRHKFEPLRGAANCNNNNQPQLSQQQPNPRKRSAPEGDGSSTVQHLRRSQRLSNNNNTNRNNNNTNRKHLVLQ